MTELHPRLTRRRAELAGDLVPTRAENLRIAADNQAHDRACIAAAPHPVFTHWTQVADAVDEGTWRRICEEVPEHTRAEYETYRPPAPLPDPKVTARRAEALNRLRRQQPAIRRKDQP